MRHIAFWILPILALGRTAPLPAAPAPSAADRHALKGEDLGWRVFDKKQVEASFRDFCGKKIAKESQETYTFERTATEHFSILPQTFHDVRLRVENGECIGLREIAAVTDDLTGKTTRLHDTGYFAEPYCDDVDIRTRILDAFNLFKMGPNQTTPHPVLILEVTSAPAPCPDSTEPESRRYMVFDVARSFRKVAEVEAAYVIPEHMNHFYRLHLPAPFLAQGGKGKKTIFKDHVVEVTYNGDIVVGER